MPASPLPTPASTRRENLPWTEIWAYGAGNFAFALLGLVVAVNLQYFYTDYVGLAAGLVSWSLLFARMFDAVTDPVMGWLSDRANTRWGRRRPFFFGAAIPLGVAFYFLFTPPEVADPAASQAFLLLYMLALYVLTYFVWTVGAVPYFSLGAELSDDYHERVRLISVREAWALSGLLAATLLPAYLIDTFGGRDGYSFMGAVLGAATTLFLLGSAVAVRERAEFHGRPALNPYAGWIATLRNEHFRRLLLAFTANAIGAAVPAVLVIYVSVYVIGTPDWWSEVVQSAIPWLPTWSYYLLVYFGSGVLALPLWNVVAGRLGKKATWGVAIAIAATGSAACWWLGEGSVGMFTLILIANGAAFGNSIALPPSMVADLIDHDEVSTGMRREGSYFALWGFATKLGNAITGFAALQVLEHVGYEPGVEQSAQVKAWMLGMFSWFPAFFYAIAALFLARFSFSRDDLEEAQRRVGRGRP